MGTYRLLLAITVVASHLHFDYYSIHTGVCAVVSFFMLSGFVMSALIEHHYTDLRQTPAFYADRALRIVPQFWFYLIIAVIALKLGLLRPSLSISACSAPRIAANFSVLTLEFAFFNQLWMCMPLNQTWSLGLEGWFYLIVPFILAFRLRGAAALMSAAVFLCAYVGIIKTELHGYFLLDGTLFIFKIGSFIYTRRNLTERVMPWIFWGGRLSGAFNDV